METFSCQFQVVYSFLILYLQKPVFVGLGVVMVTVAFGLITYFLKKQGSEKRPVALDPQKKIPFKLIDKKVFIK